MFAPKPRLTFLLLALLLTSSIYMDAQVTCTPVFINEYRLSGGNLQALSVKALPDGSILVAGKAYTGRTIDGTASPADGYICKLNPAGAIVWTHIIGGPNDDYFTGITLLNDGGAMLYGATIPFGHTDQKGWLLRIDAAGNPIWSRAMGSPATGNDLIKAVRQYTDGDIVGTLNISDNTSASDPVVFKIGLDETMRWTHQFDNGGDDGFTSIAFSGDTIFAAGYYTTGGIKKAVMTEMKAIDGTHLNSRYISCLDASYTEEILGLEIYNNTISYGIYANQGPSGFSNNNLLLIQTDLAGNLKTKWYITDVGSFAPIKPLRAKDGGFYLLRTDEAWLNSPSLVKLDRYGKTEWGLALDNSNIAGLTMYDLDETSDDGCVTAGFYNTYLADYTDIMRVIKTTSWGETGACAVSYFSMAVSSVDYQEQQLSWSAEPAFTPLYLSTATPSMPLTIGSFTSCNSSICKDHTPIPPGCNKTYNIVYRVDRRSTIHDVIATPDGGRIGVGDLLHSNAIYEGLTKGMDGMVIKYNSSGDIAWAKNFNTPDHTKEFDRIFRTADGNLLILGNDLYTLNNEIHEDIIMMKLDNSGNIIWTQSINDPYSRMNEAAPTPDGGFILLSGVNVIRYDANANILWKKQYYFSSDIPYLATVSSSPDAVFIGWHSQTNADKFGVTRLDLATGNEKWTRSFSSGSTSCSFNRIFSAHDSVSIILYNYTSGAPATFNHILVKLDTLGSFYQALSLGQDYLDPVRPYNYSSFDGAPATSIMTPDQDFALASRITVGGANYLSLSRFRPDGTVLWSKVFPSLPNYYPSNLQSQGKGFLIAGGIYMGGTADLGFTNAFVLKLDSSGQLQPGATTDCQAAARPFTISAYNSISAWNNQITGAADWDITSAPVSLYDQDVPITASLACYTPANCNAVNLLQKGKVCDLNDTLVYYLDNSGNCGAAATWSYDPSFFKAGLIAGDSIQLIAIKGGSSMVRAQIEGYCSFIDQSKPANVILSNTAPDLGEDTVVCTNAPITLHAGNGYNSYQWNDNSTGPDLSVSIGGKYYVTTTDQCNHQHSDTVIVTSADSLFHLTGDTSRCNNDIVPLQASKGYSNYQWSPSYQIIPQNDKAFVTPDVTTQYHVSAERRPGCIVSRSVLVTPSTSPLIKLGSDTSICTGDSLRLDAGPSFDDYKWNNGAGTQQIEIKQPGQYIIAAAYNNGCISRDTLKLLSIYKLTYPSLDKNPVLCIGSDRILDAGSNYASYLWNDASTGSSIDVIHPGTYWVTVTDHNGCITSDTTHILSQAPIPANFLPKDSSLCQYGSLIIQPMQSFETYSWSDLSNGPSLKISSPGLYWAEVSDKNGCIGRDSIFITAKTCLLGVFIPNAFTPDRNGHNDKFHPLVYGNAGHLDFIVFGRWGEKVFETQNTSDGWDGRINGSPAPAGTYVWACHYQLQGEPEKFEKGTVLLIR